MIGLPEAAVPGARRAGKAGRRPRARTPSSSAHGPRRNAMRGGPGPRTETGGGRCSSQPPSWRPSSGARTRRRPTTTITTAFPPSTGEPEPPSADPEGGAWWILPRRRWSSSLSRGSRFSSRPSAGEQSGTARSHGRPRPVSRWPARGIEVTPPGPPGPRTRPHRSASRVSKACLFSTFALCNAEPVEAPSALLERREAWSASTAEPSPESRCRHLSTHHETRQPVPRRWAAMSRSVGKSAGRRPRRGGCRFVRKAGGAFRRGSSCTSLENSTPIPPPDCVRT